MKKLHVIVCLLVVASWLVAVWGRGDALQPSAPAGAIPWPPGLPVYDHVVIVVEENKDYEQVIDEPATDTSKAPYINLTLRKEGPTSSVCSVRNIIARGTIFGCSPGVIKVLASATAFQMSRFKRPTLGPP
jgi:hypothetical protein